MDFFNNLYIHLALKNSNPNFRRTSQHSKFLFLLFKIDHAPALNITMDNAYSDAKHLKWFSEAQSGKWNLENQSDIFSCAKGEPD